MQTLQNILPPELQKDIVLSILKHSLMEDLFLDGNDDRNVDQIFAGDVTSNATLDPETQLTGVISAKACGVIAGLPIAQAIFTLVDPQCVFDAIAPDGRSVEAGDKIAEISGPGTSLLTAERVALNFLGRMSGVATLTRQYVEAVKGTGAVILDTRKTSPGLRLLDKYAVKVGEGQNHRLGLYDMVLIKDNHIDGAGGITPAVARVRKLHGDLYPIEVEVKNLAELEEALALKPTRIMLDNMSTEMMREAVAISAGQVPLEASGNVSLETVREIAETGVDYISVGALTHSVPVFDISMRIA